MTDSEVYCGATVDGGLCLHPLEDHYEDESNPNGRGTPRCAGCGYKECAFIPAYVRCPECDGEFKDFDWDCMCGAAWRGECVNVRDKCYSDCRCATTPTPGFITAEEAQP